MQHMVGSVRRDLTNACVPTVMTVQVLWTS
jgi:hypothetical protein